MPMTTAARATSRSGGLAALLAFLGESLSEQEWSDPERGSGVPEMGDELVGPVSAAQRDRIRCDDQPDADLADEQPDPRDALHG